MASQRNSTPILLIVAFLSTITATLTNSLPPDFQCPSSIHTLVPGGRIRYRGDDGDSSIDASMHVLHSVMSTCPDISDIQLRIALLGCTGWPDRWDFPFNQAGGDFFPSRPQTLSLEGYEFGESEWDRSRPPPLTPGPDAVYPGLWYRWAGWWDDWGHWLTSGRARQWFLLRNLPGEQRAKRNLHLWLDAMDFSAVSNLTLRDVRPSGSAVLISSLSSRLPALKVLSIADAWALDFLRALPGASLSHLTWIHSGLAGDGFICNGGGSEGLADDDSHNAPKEECGCENSAEEADAALREIWLRHGGPQLQSLDFRGKDSISGHALEALTVSQLRALAAAAPNLRELTIDLDRGEGHWPEEKLRVLATELPALESLSLYLELASDCGREFGQDLDNHYLSTQAYLSMQEAQGRQPCLGDDRFMKPLVNEATVADLFALLRRLNVDWGGGKLKEVSLYSGDWSRKWDGPLYVPSWLEGKTSWAKCLLERSDGEEEESMYCEGVDSRLGHDGDDWDDWDDWDD